MRRTWIVLTVEKTGGVITLNEQSYHIVTIEHQIVVNGGLRRRGGGETEANEQDIPGTGRIHRRHLLDD